MTPHPGRDLGRRSLNNRPDAPLYLGSADPLNYKVHRDAPRAGEGRQVEAASYNHCSVGTRVLALWLTVNFRSVTLRQLRISAPPGYFLTYALQD